MAKSPLKTSSILLVLAVLALTAGCKIGGGGSSSSSSASAVTGVATPTTVSVVTANNAN